ncbi:tetratricopeptide repeat protein [Dictyobacter alpinus]|uniref:Tetratricopeptide repeat protein n=1 Tax=Dictyobacter alpinus TaxID=2014873 RepID=A0A402BDP6_9CHLR|nr:FxSxx-COOH system tetratricopeptide repeat protein [Dictyobacter alpinus]GCE29439.1 tetratricopeptide repeat protein [Dictyobacter alpinus]
MGTNEIFPFGDLLKNYRKRKHITQRNLAILLGVHYNTIWAWEQGDYLPGTRGIVLELARLLDLDTSDTGALLEASLTALPPYWNIPYQRNAFFTGREVYLKKLYHLLGAEQEVHSTQSCVLSGMSGIGKTQIALEYAYRYHHEFSAVFWLAAETQESLITSCTSIAAILKLDEQHQKEQYKILSAVKEWLTFHRQWLVIVDNVEHLEVIRPVLPAARQGSLLFTTRLQTLGSLAPVIPVERMSHDESRTLFLIRRAFSQDLHPSPSTVEEHMTDSIVALLDGLPLALDQAGAYIAKTGCSPSDFSTLFNANPFQLLDEREHLATYPFSVAKTFTLSFSRIQQTNPAAAALLGICSFLAPDAIPEALITENIGCLDAHVREWISTPFTWQTLFEDLLSHSLVNRHAHTKTISLHRLVKTILTQALPEDDRRIFLDQALCLVNQAFPALFEQIEYWSWCEQVVPHALTVLHHCEQETLSSLYRSELLTKTAAYLTVRARYNEAEKLYQHMLALQQQTLGRIHAEVAGTLNQLGKLAYWQGKYAEAETNFRQSLDIRENVLGSLHPDVAACLNNLGDLSLKQGQYAEAERLFQRALLIREKAQGPMHSAVALPLNNLALLYFMQERYTEAEPLYDRALQLREQSQSSMQLELAFPLNNLAMVYAALNRYEEAEALYRRAIRIREQAQGSGHPDLASPLTNLADLSVKQGKYHEAAALYQRALKNLEESLGSDHQEASYCIRGLAELAAKQGEEKQAEEMFLRALQIQERALGQHHPELLELLCELAQLYRFQQRYEEAEPLYQRALAIGKEAFGPSHKRFRVVLQHYTALLYTTQRNREAAQLEHLYASLSEDVPHM